MSCGQNLEKKEVSSFKVLENLACEPRPIRVCVLQPTLRPAHPWLWRRGAGRFPAIGFQRTGFVWSCWLQNEAPIGLWVRGG